MNMYQLQQFHIQPMMMKMDNTMRKRERSKAMEKERLHVMDLSGMSLEFLPKPSLDLATICKLDLSNNNLQVSLKINSVIYFDLFKIMNNFRTLIDMEFRIIFSLNSAKYSSYNS